MLEGDEAWLEVVRRLVTASQSFDLGELELSHDEFRVRMKRETHPPGAVPPPTIAVLPSRGGAEEKKGYVISAPLTGILYRSATPTARPYVSEGEWIDEGAVIALIETMKIFNEVVADRAGKVLSFHAQAGQLVHEGDALVTLDPADRTSAEAATDASTRG